MRSRIRGHVVALLRGSVESLRYYVKKLLPTTISASHNKTSSDSDTILILSMLEMILALALRSLPEEHVAEYSPKSRRPAKRQTVHWLFQRGVENDTDIEELEKVSGTTIGRAIHMLICVLEGRRPPKSSENTVLKLLLGLGTGVAGLFGRGRER